MTETLSKEALAYATQRVEDFATVNKFRAPVEKIEAVNTWLAYLGLEDGRYDEFCEWLDRFLGPGWDGPVLIGFAVGLLVNQFNHGDA